MTGGPFGTLPPVPGWAPGIRALADALEATGRRLAAACTDLARLRDGAVWDGPAGAAFGTRIDAVPGLLDRAARRHLCAATPLRVFADVLEDEQAVVQRCVDEHAEAGDRWLVLEERAVALVGAGRVEDAPEMLVVRELQREQVETMVTAEARHRAASDRLAAADGHCARVLGGLADDDLSDSAVYRGLRAASATGYGVGAVAGTASRLSPQLRLVGAVGDGVAVGADTALLVGYDEGSWTELGVSAGAAALGAGGQTLRTGAKAGAVVRADGRVVAVSRLSAKERLVIGATTTARSRLDEARSLLDLAPDRGTASALVGGPAVRVPGSFVRRSAARARALARGRYDAARTELALASAGGRSTTAMYGAGVTLQAAGRGVEHLAPDREDRGR